LPESGLFNISAFYFLFLIFLVQQREWAGSSGHLCSEVEVAPHKQPAERSSNDTRRPATHPATDHPYPWIET
jgi:hypothetical protein